MAEGLRYFAGGYGEKLHSSSISFSPSPSHQIFDILIHIIIRVKQNSDLKINITYLASGDLKR